MIGVTSLLLSLLALPALVSPLTLSTPDDVTSGGSLTVTWTTSSDDPSTFGLYIVAEDTGTTLAIDSSVTTSDDSVAVDLPTIDSGTYYLEAVDISNITDVYSSSDDFTVTAASSSAGSSSTSAVASASASAATVTSASAALSSASAAVSSSSAASASSSTASSSKSTTTKTSTTTSSTASSTSSSSSSGALRLDLFDAPMAMAFSLLVGLAALV
ncbi:hypothetical protein FISHEDRAFT_68863 [Fistulina hepatica ATCC 64428]|uniref:Yeast cell wall synthesis Kre9/Knh1-like N-terminal domain-containing protein n=1 Tax=Fistulina hepatica ATCC 64428 TaxID=1128425 RepID=A0A0D7AQB5_9AGAR|nr:hypothetical protein FISHEDRAFT_68863 [Fistulina hepatica ATCC 64428]